MLDLRGKNQVLFRSSPKQYMRSPASRNVPEKWPRRAEKAHRKRFFLKKVAPTSLLQKKYCVAPVESFFRNEATRTQHYGTQM